MYDCVVLWIKLFMVSPCLAYYLFGVAVNYIARIWMSENQCSLLYSSGLQAQTDYPMLLHLRSQEHHSS